MATPYIDDRNDDHYFIHHPDLGCEVASRCLSCPLEFCKEDDPAKWGYSECTEDTGQLINDPSFTASKTTLAVDSGTNMSPGDTLLIESEQLYVTAVSGNNLTAERGVNGTTAATHADDTAISRFVYPKQLVEAVVMQASRLWTRRASGFADEAGFAETGLVTPVKGLGLDVRQMLDSFRIPTLE